MSQDASALLELQQVLEAKSARVEALELVLERRSEEQAALRQQHKQMEEDLKDLCVLTAQLISKTNPQAAPMTVTTTVQPAPVPPSGTADPAERALSSDLPLPQQPSPVPRPLAPPFDSLSQAVRRPLQKLDQATDTLINDILAKGQAGFARSLADANAWGREALERLRLEGSTTTTVTPSPHDSVHKSSSTSR